MHSVPTRTIVDEITDFLATEPSPREIIAYQLSEALQERADYLAERNGEDLLTPSEREEMDEIIKADRIFSLLKTKMKLKLKNLSE